MNIKARIAVIGWALAVTGAGGIFTTSDYYTKIGLDASYTSYAYYLFSMLLLLAAYHAIRIVLAKSVITGRRLRGYLNRGKHFHPRNCQPEDLEYIINNSNMDTNEETDDDQTKRIYDLHQESFTIIKDGNGKIRGYYCLLPLSSAGESAVKQGVFSLRSLSADFIRADKKNYVPLYIAGVYGNDSGHLNTFLLAELVGNIRRIKSRAIYARAATDKGLYWLTNYHFEPVIAGEGGLGKLYKLTNIRY